MIGDHVRLVAARTKMIPQAVGHISTEITAFQSLLHAENFDYAAKT